MANGDALIGRAYEYGVQDCYALVRDWYAAQGIALPDFTRPTSDQYWRIGDDVFGRHFAQAGFSVVDDLQPGDGLLFRIASEVENHCAVYLGDNCIIHHARGRLSCREPYSDFWRKHTTRVLRHENHRPIG